MKELDEFTSQYIETALWSSTDSEGNPLDGDFGIGDIDEKSLEKMTKDCEAFQSKNYPLISNNVGLAGHDFWLTRNGHGAGFWDGDWAEPEATNLTNASKKFRESNLYIGDDGLVHVD